MRNANRSRNQTRHMTGTAAALVLAAALAPLDSASAYTETVLYNFCAQTNCTDGFAPEGKLLADSTGNLFGATFDGGAHGYGVIFELVKNGSTFTYQVLYSFCALQNCADGLAPNGGIIADVHGNLYGTTSEGGVGAGPGTIFKLHRNKKGVWKLTTLHSFCSASGCTDGYYPIYGLTYQGHDSGSLYDGHSTLYGTTVSGGSAYAGVAFQLTGRTHTYGTIYQFCAQTNCTDGDNPNTSLALDSAGNLFGGTEDGGNQTYIAGGGGVVFELTPSGASFTESVLYDFCSLSGCADGFLPSGLLLNGGYVKGTTYQGGDCDTGTIFSLDTNNNEHVTDSFCSYTGTLPAGDVLYDSGPGLMGVAVEGGEYGYGVVWSYGTGYSVLYNFCFRVNCIDGAYPTGGVTADGSGHFFGAALGGSNKDTSGNGAGVIYELSP
jgi:uncharacterized repeat protein (TIGR03803 family)